MIEETLKAEIDRLKLELLRRDNRINWLQDRVDLWSSCRKKNGFRAEDLAQAYNKIV